MSTYYEYEDVKRNIAHRLFKMEGWTVYGYKPDESDIMTDYWSPASWDGIAEKNGYRLVIDHKWSREDKTETRIRYNNGNLSMQDLDKIKKLEQMTQERGASEQEEQTARAAIEKIKNRVEEGREEYTVFTPGHMANPPRCNWHIEKDGIIYDKGTGLLKFYGVPDISRDDELKDWQEYNNKTEEQWKADYIKWLELHPRYFNNCDTEEGRINVANYRYEEAKEKYATLEKFNLLLNRFNNVCGGMVGNAGTDEYTYEEITVTEYKTELKPVEKPGEIREGQCFILKSSFNYGYNKGYVYRIHESYVRTDGKQAYKAYRLGKGYKKERTGNATPSNEWSIYNTDDLMKWINKGAIAFCELEEVKTPYDVKKVVKKYNKATESTEQEPETADNEPETATAEECTAEPETVTESHTESETATTPEEPEEQPTKEAEPETITSGFSFEELARAWASGKTVKASKAEKPKEEPKEEAPIEPEPEPEPQPESEPVKPLYNENFTPQEIARLTTGERITKKYCDDNYTTHYIGIKADNNNAVWYVYKQEGYRNTNFRIGEHHDLVYSGFIFNGKMYTDVQRINEAFTDAINARMKELIPDEETALYNFNLKAPSEYELERVEYFRNDSENLKKARKHFYEGTTPELHLIDSYKEPKTEETALYFITSNNEAVNSYAELFIEGLEREILTAYIIYNRVCSELERIKTDKNSIEHKIYKISKSIPESVKTVKVTVDTGETFKVEASGVKRLIYWDYISKYDITGRSADIQPEEIKKITHGERVLYTA